MSNITIAEQVAVVSKEYKSLIEKSNKIRHKAEKCQEQVLKIQEDIVSKLREFGKITDNTNDVLIAVTSSRSGNRLIRGTDLRMYSTNQIGHNFESDYITIAVFTYLMDRDEDTGEGIYEEDFLTVPKFWFNDPENDWTYHYKKLFYEFTVLRKQHIQNQQEKDYSTEHGMFLKLKAKFEPQSKKPKQ